MRVPELAAAAGASFLELFPEAEGDGDLFASDRNVLGEPFATLEDDALDGLPVADRVRDWGQRRDFL